MREGQWFAIVLKIWCFYVPTKKIKVDLGYLAYDSIPRHFLGFQNIVPVYVLEKKIPLILLEFNRKGAYPFYIIYVLDIRKNVVRVSSQEYHNIHQTSW